MKDDFKKLQLDELHRLSVEEYKAVGKIPVVVVLDNVRSANNVGSVFRTADAFTIEKVYLCGITCSPPHKDIQKTALGAQNSVAWESQESTLDVVKALKTDGYIVSSVEQVSNSIMLQDLEINTNLIEKMPKFTLSFNNYKGIDEQELRSKIT